MSACWQQRRQEIKKNVNLQQNVGVHVVLWYGNTLKVKITWPVPNSLLVTWFTTTCTLQLLIISPGDGQNIPFHFQSIILFFYNPGYQICLTNQINFRCSQNLHTQYEHLGPNHYMGVLISCPHFIVFTLYFIIVSCRWVFYSINSFLLHVVFLFGIILIIKIGCWKFKNYILHPKLCETFII